MWSMEVLLPLAAVGAIAGFLAGLLGIGGGVFNPTGRAGGWGSC